MRPLAVLDVETTALSPAAARVVEVAALKLRPGGRASTFYARVHPGGPVPPAATAVHGITDADVADRPPFAVVARPLIAFLQGADLAGFNLAGYDLPVLAREFARAGVPFSLAGRAVLDAFRLFTRQEPRDLAAAVRFYTGREHDGAHSAAADAWGDGPRPRRPGRPLATRTCRPTRPACTGCWSEVDVGRRFRRGPAGEVVVGFGKHAGVPLADVAGRDPRYLEWVLTTDLLDDARTLVRRALDGLPPEPPAGDGGAGPAH